MLSIFSGPNGKLQRYDSMYMRAMYEVDVHVVDQSAPVRTNPVVQAVLKTELVNSTRLGPHRVLVERVTSHELIPINNVFVWSICNNCGIVVEVIDRMMKFIALK